MRPSAQVNLVLSLELEHWADKLYIPRRDRGGQAPIATCFDRNTTAPAFANVRYSAYGYSRAYVMLNPGGGENLQDCSLFTFAMTLSRRYAKIFLQSSEAKVAGLSFWTNVCLEGL
jgi:hypothetical protein